LDVIHFNFYTVAGFSQGSPAEITRRSAGSPPLNDINSLSVGKIYEKWSGMSSGKTRTVTSMEGKNHFPERRAIALDPNFLVRVSQISIPRVEK
jgi:hypothetical protein